MIVVLDEWSSFVTMKKLLLISVTSFTLLSAQAQSLNAPNFTELDIDGNIHNLYTDYLNQGRLSILICQRLGVVHVLRFTAEVISMNYMIYMALMDTTMGMCF
jgi:hypothetical protein